MNEKKKKARGSFRHWGRSRVDVVERLSQRPLLQVVLFVLFVAVISVVIIGFTDNDTQQTYDLGEVAPRDIQARNTFTFLETDLDATERNRELAEQQVPLVFEWDESVRSQLRDTISVAFSSARRALSDEIFVKLKTEQPEEAAKFEAETAPADRIRKLIDRTDARTRVDLSKTVRVGFESAIKLEIPDDDFETLARDGFSDQAEHVLANLVSESMDKMIVESRRELDTGTGAVFLRRMRGDQLILEYRLENASGQFVPLEEVPTLVRRLSTATTADIANKRLRETIIRVATTLTSPNASYDEESTAMKRQIARQTVPTVETREEFQKGQIIVDKGHVITERDLRVIERMGEDEEYLNRSQIVTGVMLFSLLFLVILFLFGRRNIAKFNPTAKDILFMATAMIGGLMAARIGVALSSAVAQQSDAIPMSGWWFLIPVAAAPMLIRLVLNSEHSVVFSIVYSSLVGVMADQSFSFTCFTAIACLVGAGSVGQVKNRMALTWSGLLVGGVNVFSVITILLLSGELFSVSTFWMIGLALAGGFLSGLLVSAVLPLFESIFGYTTDIKLLELANLNHPALRELIMRSPGSYHHSMMVGSLCEAAAESIGCNPLLARVGSYYHDIGKSKNPGYFAENQKLGQNPHDKLKPNMSALIIKAHVKDGIEMAKQHRLPEVIQDFIAQHHGTSLIAYFYHKAKSMEDPDIPEVDEKDYRYPGPKPQTRETAICLLADGIEAASRAMAEPTPARLKGLVQKMINKAFTDGQLDECDLTLKDLNKIAESFNRILNGIYHHRPEYPSERKKDTTESGTEIKAVDPQKKMTQRTKAIEEATSHDVARSLERERETGQLEAITAADKPDDPVSDEVPVDEEEEEERKPLPRLGSQQ